MKQFKYIILFIIITLYGCSVESKFKNAEQLKNDGKYDLALKKYVKIINKYPSSEFSANSQFTISNIYLYKLKKYQQAKKEYELFLSKYSSDSRIQKANNEIERINKILSNLDNGRESLLNKQYNIAIESFQKVLVLDSESLEAKQEIEKTQQLEAEELEQKKQLEQEKINARNNLKKQIEKQISEYIRSQANNVLPSLYPLNSVENSRTVNETDDELTKKMANIYGGRVDYKEFKGENVEIIEDASNIEIIYRILRGQAEESNDEFFRIFQEALFDKNYLAKDRYDYIYEEIFRNGIKIDTLKDKISKIKIEIYEDKSTEDKKNEYGNIITPGKSYIRQIGNIEIKKTPMFDKIAWDNIENEQLQSIVRKCIKINRKYGKWIENKD